VRDIPLFPAECAPALAPREQRTDYGAIYLGVALLRNPGPAALALVSRPLGAESSRALTRLLPDPVTSPVAVVRAIGWALDLLDPNGKRADLWTNLEMAASTDQRLLELVQYPTLAASEVPGSFGALKAEVFRRCLVTGSRVRWVRTSEAPPELHTASNAAQTRLRSCA
jgi:hypothetical protein